MFHSSSQIHVSKNIFKLSLGIVVIVFLTYFILCLPKPLFDSTYSKVLEDEHGHLLSASIAKDGQWRFPPMDTLPHTFKQAIIHFEDKRFYNHLGLDFRSLARAIKQNIKARKVISGASTISMQVIRLSAPKKRTIKNKWIEIVKALRIETMYTKHEILNLYASHAPFGGNVVGLEAASWRYYGKKPALLSWSEAATLAVLPNAPSLIHPGKNRAQLKNKRDRLLGKLLNAKQLDSMSYFLALEEELPEAPKKLPRMADHLLHTAYRQNNTKAKIGKIKSSIDFYLQQQVADVLAKSQVHLDAEYIHNTAALVIHIPTGKVKAYLGNAPQAKKEHQGDVDIIQAPRSTGSVLKPFLYALSLHEGQYLPSSLIQDIPIQINGYAPKNFNKKYSGLIPYDKALSKSLNIPFVNVLQDYKVDKFYNFLQQCHYKHINKGPHHYGLSLILGGAEASLWELSSTYASMARTLNSYVNHNSTYAISDFHEPSWLSAPENKISGKRLEHPPILSAAAIWHTFAAMQEVNRPDQEGNWQSFDSSVNIAWKTGTSFGFRDAWAIGLSADYVVGVWVGNADGEGRPDLIGVKKAAPLLFDIFKLLPHTDWFEKPYDDFTKASVCAITGQRVKDKVCPSTDSLEIPIKGLNSKICAFHKLIHINQEENAQVNSSCYPSEHIVHKAYLDLPPVEAYYYKKSHPDYRPIPPLAELCQNQMVNTQPMEFIYPNEDHKIYIPIELDGSKGETIFKAVHTDEDEVLYWHLDEEYIGSTIQFHELALQPKVGKHKITIVDSKSNRILKEFEILSK